ncbi:MAG: hypothetical protein H6712_25275, partial [Myxococcales bacterium]|nr:hypothetical protein [Myxococcales bacterium]
GPAADDGAAADGGAAEGGAAADDGAAGDDGAAADDGAGDDGAAADDGAGDDDGGGDDGGKPTNGGHTRPTNRVDETKVHKLGGGVYSAKVTSPAGTMAAAKKICGSLRNKSFANLKKWRLPTEAEAKKAPKPSGKYWLKSGEAFNTATGNSIKTLRGSISGGRVVCVSN